MVLRQWIFWALPLISLTSIAATVETRNREEPYQFKEYNCFVKRIPDFGESIIIRAEEGDRSEGGVVSALTMRISQFDSVLAKSKAMANGGVLTQELKGTSKEKFVRFLDRKGNEFFHRPEENGATCALTLVKVNEEQFNLFGECRLRPEQPPLITQTLFILNAHPFRCSY